MDGLLVSGGSYDWLQEHAVQKEDESWECKITGAEIEVCWISHCIESNRRTVSVLHFHCPHCLPENELPEDGALINGLDLLSTCSVSIL